MKILMAFTLFLSGCATAMKGEFEELPIRTTPAGANVTLGEHTCHTPCNLEVQGQKDMQLVIEKPGYETYRKKIKGHSLDPWLWGNLVFLFGAPIGVGVDFYTGKAYDLSPAQIKIDLKPAAEVP